MLSGQRAVYLGIAAMVVVWIGTEGCARKSGIVQQGTGIEQVGAGGVQPADSASALGGDQAMASDMKGTPDTLVLELQDVFFEFDSALLSAEARRTLDSTARWLKKSAARRVVIEGHADERGTNEYNLVLGERRAQAVKRYLVASGIDDRRLRIVSYGEERPFCRDAGERCWRENRRGHFVADAD